MLHAAHPVFLGREARLPLSARALFAAAAQHAAERGGADSDTEHLLWAQVETTRARPNPGGGICRDWPCEGLARTTIPGKYRLIRRLPIAQPPEMAAWTSSWQSLVATGNTVSQMLSSATTRTTLARCRVGAVMSYCDAR